MDQEQPSYPAGEATPPPPPPAGAQQPFPAQPQPLAEPGYSGTWPPPPPQPPKRRSGLKLGLIIGGSIVGALVVLIVIIGVVVAVTDHSHAKHAAATTTLNTPATIAGMTRMDDGQAADLATQTQTSLAKDGDVRNTVAAFYTDEAGGDPHVFVWGGITPIDDPETAMNNFISGAKGSGVDVEKYINYPSGNLGGEFRCGQTSVSGLESSLCVWADQGSVAGVIVYGGTPSTGSALALKVREAVEHRS